MKTLLALIVLFSSMAWSKDKSSTDFSRSDSEIKTLTLEELSWKFHVTGEVFVVNSEGDKLLSVADEKREWEFGGSIEKPLESHWRFAQKSLPTVALRHRWTLEKDGRITVEISQYDTFDRASESEMKYGKLLKQEKITLKNFAPIEWPVESGPRKLIVRLTPGVWQADDPINLGTLPISGKNIVIYERNGKVWADQIATERASIYLGVTTHQGTVLLSFSPFKGAQVIGEAKGGRIKIKNKPSIFFQSETPFLPKDIKANVYGIVLPNVRSDSPNSVSSYSSDKENEFLKRFPGL